MIRMLIGFVIQLVSNALGLIIASWVLDDVTISGSAFLVAVVIFTVVYAVAQPFFTQMAMGTPALRGGVALVATLVGLIVTSLVSDGLSIEGGRDLDRGDGDRLDRVAARRVGPAPPVRQEEGPGDTRLSRPSSQAEGEHPSRRTVAGTWHDRNREGGGIGRGPAGGSARAADRGHRLRRARRCCT